MDVTLLLERLEALSLRERVMVSVAIAAVCGAAMQFLLLDPLLASADRAGQNLAAANWQGLALSQQLIEAGRNSAAERHEQLLASRAAMEASVRAVDHAIEEHAASLVAPEVMPLVLRWVLSDTDLTLLELSNEPPVALLQIGDASADAAAPTAVNGSGEAAGGVRNLSATGSRCASRAAMPTRCAISRMSKRCRGGSSGKR